MLPIFTEGHRADFQLSNSLPKDYKGYILRGGEYFTAVGEVGRIIIQEFKRPLFDIRFNTYDLVRPIEINATQERTFLNSFLAFKNDIDYSGNKSQNLELFEGQFALMNTSDLRITAKFKNAAEYQSFEISWSEDVIISMLPHFPFLYKLFKKPGNKFFLSHAARSAGHDIIGVARQFLNVPFDEGVSKVYFEYKVREYLLLLLVEANKKKPLKTKLTHDQRERIFDIASTLNNEPRRKFPISELASRSQMNEMKLKIAFKEIFGLGIFEYQLKARMQEAHRLLKETDLTTKQVAGLVGYKLTTSFITKFREYFGYPPSVVAK
ncbi:MAG: helix-turn-helix transcriptional regulator [Bacteroidetes bacterium]|nr:helix-turn-helix transcriptional regulator [Bacteroidota bacterium]